MNKVKWLLSVAALAVTTSVFPAANNVCAKYVQTMEQCFKEGLTKQCEGKTKCAKCQNYFNPSGKHKKELEAQLNQPCKGQRKAMSQKRLKEFKGCANDDYVKKSLASQLEMLKKIDGCK